MAITAIVTLSRSDYASVRPVALAALADRGIDARVVAGGSHLLARHGRTIDQIRADGIPVDAVADFLGEDDDTPQQLAHAAGRAVSAFSRIFTQLQPDQVFLLGDRWELLSAAYAASLLQLPIVHHSGGDITQGSADNQTRYAISALAHMHLTALPQHRERLLRMGEEPWRVITTGEPALAALGSYTGSTADLHARLRLAPGEPFVLATFHPTSFDPSPAEQQIERFLAALDLVPGAIVLTAPNPDPGSELFLRKLTSYAAAHRRVRLHHSLGGETYYAAMAAASFMVGNSSSGLWEAPSFRLPVINLGPRQQGRAHGDNVIHSSLDQDEIRAAIARAGSTSFRDGLDGVNPYVRPDTIALILDCLRHPRGRAELLAKRFVDPLQHGHPCPGT